MNKHSNECDKHAKLKRQTERITFQDDDDDDGIHTLVGQSVGLGSSCEPMTQLSSSICMWIKTRQAANDGLELSALQI